MAEVAPLTLQSPSYPFKSGSEAQDMNETPAFSFPAITNPPTSQSISSAYKPAHRRARTSLQLSTPALPPFVFNPSSTVQESAPLTPTSAVTLPSPQAAHSPGTRRHRRVVSEFGGGRNQDVAMTMVTPVESTIQTPSLAGQASGNCEPYRNHRHRRSGAISSDLTAFRKPPVAVSDREIDDVPASGGAELSQPDTLSSSPTKSPRKDVSVATRTVGFSDTVVVIPRPSSMVSSESGSSQSTIRDVFPSSTWDSALDSHDAPPYLSPVSRPVYTEEPTAIRSTNSLDHATFSDAPPLMEVDESELYQNFEEDPTLTQLVHDDQIPTYLPSATGSLEASIPNLSYWRTKSRSISDATVIDLDVACVDALPPRPSSASGFERKRASMHASMSSGFWGVGSSRHRRAESAPSLAPPSFPSAFGGGSAAERGFEMENVFEEEEEDDEDYPTPSPGISIPGEESASKHEFLSPIAECVETMSDSPHTAPSDGQAKRSKPSLLPAIQFEAEKAVSPLASEEENDLPMPHAAFMDGGLQSASASSSPRGYYQNSMNSSEPSPRFHQSVDDVPSLISGGSTVGSISHPTFPTTSMASLAPGISATGSSYSVATSSKFHRKKSSIISLSRLIGVHSRSSDLVEQVSNQPSISSNSSGLKPPTHHSRSRRLSRYLKFWKGREGSGEITNNDV